MSPRRTILRTLSQQHRTSGPDSLTRPGSIPGFTEKTGKFQEAVNSLLQDRLIEGTKDSEGRLAIRLNTHRMVDVRKELRPFWSHPAVLALLGILAVVAGVGLLG